MVLLVEGGSTDVDVSTRLAAASYTAPDNAIANAVVTALLSNPQTLTTPKFLALK